MQPRSEYILFPEAARHASGKLMWRFLLLEAGNHETVTASDLVDESSATRTELLAVVRGLESLDGPANVRLFTTSDYIQRGFDRGLAEWRRQDWHWENFGRRVPIRDCKLWQRVDHALAFHTVEARFWGDPTQRGEQLALQADDSTAVESQVIRVDAPHTSKQPATVKPRQKQRRRRSPSRVAAAARNKLGDLRRGVESLMEPTLAPVG